MSFSSRFDIHSPTGAVLNTYHQAATAPARGVVQINHGMAEHGARYARFAAAMADEGFHIYAHDHRGHGHTKAPDAPLAHFGSEPAADKIIADVDAVHDHIAQAHPGLPVILFGHSMGGLIALNYLFAHSNRVAAAAIWNANFSAGAAGRAAQAVLAWERFRLGSDVPSRILPKLTFQAWGRQVKVAKTGFDWLSRDAAEVDKYIADPLCGFDVSVGTWRTVFGFIFAGANDAGFKPIRRNLPVFLVGGERDPATNGGKAVQDLAERMRRMGFSNLQSTIYDETRHESLNELNRNLITADFAAWAKRALA
ncbi:alpha/beta fold hydrolase [Aliihoeflea aestuarii]|jgi:alpha-beta hydrolase superfamily lysophospholipase|uniref:alpha/beta fold hydrolase n=1 Tax=Aliihoeflea aestuarii TaxID=453840 RepID=UPI0020953457|nr:alpha/beta hydrolase [Aliihoeflea aestuarii]MCO6392212.1 alpha/beta fold hydrolase [Aliihoeflea aestuarii]